VRIKKQDNHTWAPSSTSQWQTPSHTSCHCCCCSTYSCKRKISFLRKSTVGRWISW